MSCENKERVKQKSFWILKNCSLHLYLIVGAVAQFG